MSWWVIVLLVVIPSAGFGLGYLMGRDHQGRLHAQRRREVNER